MYGTGISKSGEILDLAVKLDIIKKSGAWFYYKEERLGQGRDNVKEYIQDNPALMEELSALIRENKEKLMETPGSKKAAAKKAAAAAAAAEKTPVSPTPAADIAIEVGDDEDL